MSQHDRQTGGQGWGLLLRDRGEGGAPVEPIELFFDLVYVFAVTQLSHMLLAHLSPRGAGETLLLLMAVWSAWSFTSWVTSWFDAHLVPVRLVLVVLMLISLLMSAAIPDAFGEQGLAFALAYVAIQVGRNAWSLAAVGRSHRLSRRFLRVLLWSIVLGVVWIAGGLASEEPRLLIWTAAVVIDYLIIWLGFPFPGLGRNPTREWSLAGEHLAERYELFIILALGESILLTGTTYAGLPRSPATLMAVVIAFTGSVALWWLYFDRGARAGREAIATTGNPGRFGLFAYSYFHLPMVAGIIMAAGADELTIAHPLDSPTTALTVLLLGGPALYLAGNALFGWVLKEHLPASRVVAIVALLALTPFAAHGSALRLAFAATVIVSALVLWDVIAGRRQYRQTALKSSGPS